MPNSDCDPRLTLRFTGEETIELSATEFSLLADGRKIERLVNHAGKGGKGSFEWREGMQALCHCLIKYRCYPKDQLSKGLMFTYPGGCKSPASTLDYVVKKSGTSGCWQINVFGVEGRFCRIQKYIKRRHSRRGGRINIFKAEIQHHQLPQESVLIELNGVLIDDPAELEKLADDIENQWYEITDNLSSLVKLKELRKQKAKKSPVKKVTSSANDVNNLQAQKNTSSGGTEPILESSETTAHPKFLAELFRPLSVKSIISHITAAMLPARGALAIEKFSAEILYPDCVNVLAEKLVSESISSFNDFFHAAFEPPFESLPLVPDELNPQKIKDFRFEGPPVPDIKRSVGVFIASNRNLRQRLASMAARCGFSDMCYWFTAMSLCHARESERKIVHEVERELGAAAEEPDFKERFLVFAPDRLPELIQYFSHYDCVVAVRLFEKINQEGREEERRIQEIIYGDTIAEQSKTHRTKPHRKH